MTSRRQLELERALDNARTALDYLEAHAAEALRRGALTAMDGYPTATLGGGSPGTCSCPDEADNCPHGSSTERAALAGNISDPVGQTIRHMLSQTKAMADAGIFAMQACHRVVNVAAPEDPDDGCVTHARYGRYATADKAGRCRWCYERRDDHNGAGPTREEVVAHDEGPVYGRRVKRRAS